MQKFIITFTSYYDRQLSKFTVIEDSENNALKRLYQSGHEVNHIHHVQRIKLAEHEPQTTQPAEQVEQDKIVKQALQQE